MRLVSKPCFQAGSIDKGYFLHTAAERRATAEVCNTPRNCFSNLDLLETSQVSHRYLDPATFKWWAAAGIDLPDAYRLLVAYLCESRAGGQR